MHSQLKNYMVSLNNKNQWEERDPSTLTNSKRKNDYMAFTAAEFITKCNPAVEKMFKFEFDRAAGNDQEYKEM